MSAHFPRWQELKDGDEEGGKVGLLSVGPGELFRCNRKLDRLDGVALKVKPLSIFVPYFGHFPILGVFLAD